MVAGAGLVTFASRPVFRDLVFRDLAVRNEAHLARGIWLHMASDPHAVTTESELDDHAASAARNGL